MTLEIQKKLKSINNVILKNTTMKVKHLLFSSIFLSMGFAACTNEVEEFASQTPDYPGIELGEDFTINVTNSDFAADSETRAAFEQVGTKWIPAWGKDANGNPDAIGAAWFSKFKYDENRNATGATSVYTALDEYGSNAKFVWQGEQSFKSEAVSKLGAYVLYYPFNENLTDDMTQIPVVGIPANQPFDVENPTEQVTKNITAANVVVFDESGANAPEFTIQQIPNLYALSFNIQNEELMSLTDDINITHVMVEAVANDGKGAIYTNGYIEPSTFDPSNKYYNGTEKNSAYIPVIEFYGTDRTDRMIVTVNNSNEDYWITETGAENGTKQFFFSMLPVLPTSSEDPDAPVLKQLTFKVIAKVGSKTMVFEKPVDLNKTYVGRMAQTGETIALNVGLTNSSTFDGIYSVEQFIEYWNAGETNFNLQIPLDLTNLAEYEGGEDVNFALAEDKAVTFSNMKVTLPTISGNYTFENEVSIIGDATLVGGAVEKPFNVTGNLTVDATSVKSMTIGAGTIGVEGQKVGGKLTTKGTVKIGKIVTTGNVDVVNGKLTLGSKSVINGSVSVRYDKNGTTTLVAPNTTIKKTLTVYQGTEAQMSGAWSADALNVNGGTLTQTSATAKATIAKNVTVKKVGEFAPVLNMTGTIAITKSLIVNEGIESGINIGAAIEVGDVTANSAVNFGAAVTKMGNITAAADVTFNGEVTEVGNIGTAEAPANGKITFNQAVTKAGAIYAAKDVKFAKAAATNEINTAAPVTFGATATTGAITTTANVTFVGTATVQGDINATGNIAIKGTDVKVMKEVEGSDPIYYDVILKEEAKLEASNLVANNVTVSDQYSKLTVSNSMTIKNKLEASGNVDAAVNATSSIAELTIKPGIRVTLTENGAMSIGKLNTEVKGDYVGTLLTNNVTTTINGGTNEGKIDNIKQIIVGGSFDQKNEIVNTVKVDAGTFTVYKSMSKTITNNTNGTVIVKGGQTATVANSGVLEVEDKAVVTLSSNAGTTNIASGATVTLNKDNAGTINVVNGSILNTDKVTYKYDAVKKVVKAKVAYAWTEDCPTGDILKHISQIDLQDATISPAQVSACTYLKVINVSGTLTTNADLDWNTPGYDQINAVGSAGTTTTFAGSKAGMDVIAKINVAEKVTLATDENTTFKDSEIILSAGASFNGKKSGSTTVTMN